MARKDDVIDTGYPGIKQRKSDGKYIVTLDLGRRRKVDKKTGEVKIRQVKSTRVVSTLKEAKSMQGKNNQVKRHKKVSGVAGKVRFDEALKDYMKFKETDWGVSHRQRQETYSKRLLAFFGDRDVREIDTLDVEMFYQWCREEHGDFKPISNNTIKKIQSMLSQMYKYMKKSPTRYDVHSNPVEDSDSGKKEAYEAEAIPIDIVNEIMRYMLDNEKDTSFFVMWGLACLSGMRRGEICGLKWGDIDWKTNRIYVSRQRIEVSKKIDKRGWIEKTPKNGSDSGKTPQERKERWAAMPAKCAELLKLAKKQQEAYGRKKVTDKDYVYRSKTNIVNDYLPDPGKLDRRWNEFQDRCNKVRKKAGKELLPHYRLHDLRHTHISLCLNDGVNPLQVAAASGHTLKGSGFMTTIAVYWHDDGNRKDVIECIDRLVTTEVSVPDLDDDLLTPAKRRSKRKHVRNDEL